YVEQMKAAGIDITATGDMLLEIWKKFVVLSGTSGITASTRQALGVIRDDADMRCFLLQAYARDDGRRLCGGRRVAAGLPDRAGPFGGWFSAEDEGVAGDTLPRGQPPRTGLARRQSGRPRT